MVALISRIQVKEYILSGDFRNILLKLKKVLTDNFDHMVHMNTTSRNPIALRSDYCDSIGSDKRFQYLLLDYIGLESSTKHCEYSRFFEQIDMTQMRMSSTLKEILISYWTSDQAKGMIEPARVNFDKLAVYINSRIRVFNKEYMITPMASVPAPMPGVTTGQFISYPFQQAQEGYFEEVVAEEQYPFRDQARRFSAP